jgi:hypothetical protein
MSLEYIMTVEVPTSCSPMKLHWDGERHTVEWWWSGKLNRAHIVDETQDDALGITYAMAAELEGLTNQIPAFTSSRWGIADKPSTLP